MRLTDKIAVITGAASGLSRATAVRFAREGAKVVLGDIDEAGGAQAAEEISVFGGEAVFVRTDVTRPSDVEILVSAAVTRYRRVDILVNGAGLLRRGYLQDFTENDWNVVMDVNLKGVFLCCRAVIPIMIRQRHGVIINVSSSGARGFNPIYPAYVAAKAGVLGLTQCLTTALREHGIVVMALCPGYVNTPMGDQAFREITGSPPTESDLAAMMQPEQVAGVILNLVDPEMRFASGTVVDLYAI